MQIAKLCFFFFVLATTALFMPHAKATCSTPNMPKLFTMASVSVSTTLPVGATIPGSEQTAHVSGSCDTRVNDGLPIAACYYGYGTEITGINGVYATSIAGIGIALVNDKGQRVTGANGSACDSSNTPLGYVSSDGKSTFDFDVTIELVKTSETVASGTLAQSQTQFGVGVLNLDPIGAPNIISYAGNVTLKEVTCNVSPKSLTVMLGDFPVSDFTGTGTLTTPQTFTVNVNCADTVQPEVKITSANGYETSFPGVIKLTQESGVATGVGVRMLFDGAIAAFDTYKDTAAVAEANTTLAIPFEVAYEQTASNVTPGTANSIATITLGYK